MKIVEVLQRNHKLPLLKQQFRHYFSVILSMCQLLFPPRFHYFHQSLQVRFLEKFSAVGPYVIRLIGYLTKSFNLFMTPNVQENTLLRFNKSLPWFFLNELQT